MGNLAKGEGIGRADAEAVAKLTSVAKWSRVTATARVLAVRELIVARRRSRASAEAKTPTHRYAADRPGEAGSGRRVQWAGWQGGEGRSGERAAGVLLSRSFPRSERRARVLLGGALARGLPQRAEPAFLWAGCVQ